MILVGPIPWRMVLASKRRHYFKETMDSTSKTRIVYYKRINSLEAKEPPEKHEIDSNDHESNEEWLQLPANEDRAFETLFIGSSINISASGSNQYLSASFIDLIHRTLSLDPVKRVSAAEAQNHQFFDVKL